MIIEKIGKDVEDYFRKLVTDEFQEHSGLALKYLCDLHKGICPNGHEEIELKIDILTNEFNLLREQVNQQVNSKKEHIRGLSGNIIK